jgi:hypothetical protein
VLNRIEKNYEFNHMLVSVVGTIAQSPVGEIVKNKVIEQTFVAEQDNLTAFSLQMATYNRTNTGHVSFDLYNNENQLVAHHSATAEKIKDNLFYLVKIPAIKRTKDQVFHLRISSSDGVPGNALTVWASESPKYQRGQLTVNGEINSGDLVMKIYYR